VKLRAMSDLHLEFGPINLEPIGEDVLALVGDVGLDDMGARWAARWSEKHRIPVVMIAGNHEFYNGGDERRTIDETLQNLRDVAARCSSFHFLDDGIAVVAGCVFIGSTLWTDYNLNGQPEQAKMLARMSMNDHRLIRDDDRTFDPEQAYIRHMRSVGILRERLPHRMPSEGPTVVMTHHLPSKRSIAGRYADNAYNAAYASNLDDLVAASEAALWLHGHTHVSQDYQIGETRVICNPRGYVGHEVNRTFNPDLLIDLR
jgi:DNA repair exonuclease SbcCD nuclease subunit